MSTATPALQRGSRSAGLLGAPLLSASARSPALATPPAAHSLPWRGAAPTRSCPRSRQAQAPLPERRVRDVAPGRKSHAGLRDLRCYLPTGVGGSGALPLPGNRRLGPWGTRLSPQRLSRPHPNSSGRCGPQGGGPEGGVPAPAPARAGAALGGRDGRGALCARHPS